MDQHSLDSVGGWSCAAAVSHTCESSASLRQLFKEQVADHLTPECRRLWFLLRLTSWDLPVFSVQSGPADLCGSTFSNDSLTPTCHKCSTCLNLSALQRSACLRKLRANRANLT
ncbi:hypothetical protein AMECASPLE_033266 [Ameca splendens]|uniref:Uncharacterized protein n=1 Tax=Ameca splendens TaxID=208324 RepID=A0ABV0YTV0_9TELE